MTNLSADKEGKYGKNNYLNVNQSNADQKVI